MAACDSCSKPISGPPKRTVTGRTLCSTCNDSLLGATALGSVMFVLPLAAILVLVVTAQLLLWSPPLRVRLVNWFFRLNDEEPATLATGPSI